MSQATQSSPAATTAPLPATAIPVEAASTETAAAASARQPDAAQITQAVEEVRAAITPVAQNLHFSIDKDINRTIVKVVDASTDEVIRQIPSEEIIAIAKAVDKLQGLLIKQEA
nr:flagellar protein FlaG [Thauera linaloolentis]